MPCGKPCSPQREQFIEDSEWLTPALEIFLRSYHLLKNFMEFYRSRIPTCPISNYDKVPLHGALNIVAAAVTTLICGGCTNREFQRSTLFRDMLVCLQCQGMQDHPAYIVHKVDMLMACLQSSCDIENIIKQIKQILSIIEEKCPSDMPERLRLLSFLLKEIMQRYIKNEKILDESPRIELVKLVLNLVNSFIGDWSERKCQTSSFLKICRFCDHIINETTRQLGIFCCKESHQFNSTWKEWTLRQSISDRGKVEDPRIVYEEKKKQVRIGICCEESSARRDTDYDSCVREIDDRRDSRCRKADKFDRVKGRDLTKADDRAEGREARGKIKRDRNIDRKFGDPITPDGREKRDDARCKTKPDKTRESRGSPDTAEERTANGKTRKIKRDERNFQKDQSARSKTETEDDVAYPSTGDEDEKGTDGRDRKKPRKEEDYETKEDTRKEASKEGKKKADVVDSGREALSRGVDEEGKVPKGDGKRKVPLDSTEATDPDSMKKSKAKEPDTSREDKSTVRDREDRSSKRGLSPASEERSRQCKTSKTDDDYSKISGSRYREGKPGPSKVSAGEIDPRRPIEYQLSDQLFVKLGWTMLPIAKVMRKIVQYQASPAKPHLDWFKMHGYKGKIYYDDGITVFLDFTADGSGEVFYPNGIPAIKVYRPENRKYDIYTVSSLGGKDYMGIERKSQIVAVFDSMGNGAVFDEDGTARLSYNQIGGIQWDNPTGLPLSWKWDTYEKKSIIKTVYVEKSPAHLEKYLHLPTKPTLKSSENGKAATSNVSSQTKEKKAGMQKAAPEQEKSEEVIPRNDIKNYSKDVFKIRSIHMKLNSYISLRILNRRNIHLQFFAGKKSIRMELGTVLDLDKETASDFVNYDTMDIMLTSKFVKPQLSQLTSDSSLYNLALELREARKSSRQRARMIAKYRPFTPACQKPRTRCQIQN